MIYNLPVAYNYSKCLNKGIDWNEKKITYLTFQKMLLWLKSSWNPQTYMAFPIDWEAIIHHDHPQDKTAVDTELRLMQA